MPQVRNRDGSGVCLIEAQPDGRHYLLVLEEARARCGIGEDHAVHHEVAVVHDLAEVAAIAEELGAVYGSSTDAVVAPFPHETAVQARIRVH